ncbi:MAG TPA: glycosyltransferase [Verrucomicrobiae bacterium]|nr:glycosyltransferase [Verrucomicrobiae bacterium]
MSYAPFDAPSLNRASNSRDNSLLSSTSSSFQTTSKRINGHRRVQRSGHDCPIIVHSHLCWDWVWQRPQQFLSRLSRNHKILFVEMHRPDAQLVTPSARIKPVDAYPNVTILQMQMPLWRWHNGQWVDEHRRGLLQEALAGPLRGQFDQPIQWFYDPMAVTAFAGEMDEICTVYDCMDELSKFRGAPPAIVEREAELLKIADVVFTGGRKLFESKSRFHSNCHFYGCGVDVEHFGKARVDETRIPDDTKELRKPVLGFFGVVDERMDYELAARLADADPNWSVVIIGPAIKVDEAAIPRRPNLHWLGGREYADLPAYCKAFDVCIMPFALNEATEYINPTKALEYMATGRNIVSTAVPDVVRNFGSVVKIANSHQEFINLCREVAQRPDRDAIERGIQMAEANTWESIVQKLDIHMAEAISKKSVTAPG